MKLHKIHKNSIALALEKAKQYRTLLEPEIAISICLDILEIDEDNQNTLVVYILALTDQLSHTHKKTYERKVIQAISKLKSKYEKLYYTGIFYERKARAMLKHSMSHNFACDVFTKAMDFYEQARKIHPKGNDDAILRSNSCIRTIEKYKLKPKKDSSNLYHSYDY